MRDWMTEEDAELYLDGKLIWRNPKSIGWVGIKARKQSREYAICARLDKEMAAKKATHVGENPSGADNQQETSQA